MFIGHNAVGFAVKRLAPEVSLGTLFLAAQLPDLVWPVLLTTGHEVVTVEKGANPFLNLRFDYYPFSHSLAGCAAMGLVLGFLWRAFSPKKSLRGFLVIFAAVMSHWVLDWVTHVPDLPLTFMGSQKYGLGLWNSVPATMTVELILFGIGVFLYVKGTKAKKAVGNWALWSFVVFLLLLYVGDAFGPVPPNATIVAYMGFSAWLMVIWGYWIDTTRRTGPEPPAEAPTDAAPA